MDLLAAATQIEQMLEDVDYNATRFKWALYEAGGTKIGSGSYKTGFTFNGVVIKWHTRARSLKGVVAKKHAKNAVNEMFLAPVKVRPFMAQTTAVEGVIIQEKAQPFSDWKDYSKRTDELKKVVGIESLYDMFRDMGSNNCGLRADGSLCIFDGAPIWANSINVK